MARPAISFFEAQVKAIIAERQALHAGGTRRPENPDLLDALLAARDPETGTGLSEADPAELDEDEDIEVERLPLAGAIGQLDDGASIAALALWLELQ